ncbi:6-cysteine protein [Plasmodium berghei]|uniref:6-cysteine protein n=1 Tax=Plasmodium berghei TaxID=5821 RepID=A0A0Y9WZG1_PLABE|nr:6-cysteine protein [Plasmodium berghei]
MKGLLIYTFIFLLKQLSVRSEEYVCDFRAKNYLYDNKDILYCTINAKPFDKITYICPNKIGAHCFHNVNTSNNIETSLESSQIHINYLLYGSTIYKDTLILPPKVTQNVTFYCFCSLETDISDKKLKPQKFEGVGNHNGNITLGKAVKLDTPISRALFKLNKYKDLMEQGVEENDDDTIIEVEPEPEPEPESKTNKVKPKIIKVIYKTIKGTDGTNKAKTEPAKANPEPAKANPEPAKDEPVKKKKYGVMKVTVQKTYNTIKGCDFGNDSTKYFTNPLESSKNSNTKLCQINAKPGETIGFKCIQETHGYVEPSGCFDSVYVNNYKTSLKTIIPGYTSYSSKSGSITAFYLKLPHLITKPYTFSCKCRSYNHNNDSYIFQVNVESGESDLIKNSFN